MKLDRKAKVGSVIARKDFWSGMQLPEARNYLTMLESLNIIYIVHM